MESEAVRGERIHISRKAVIECALFYFWNCKEWEGEQFFYEAVEDNPIIAAVKSMEDVEECCKHDDIRVIFILFGDVCSIGSICKDDTGCR